MSSLVILQLVTNHFSELLLYYSPCRNSSQATLLSFSYIIRHNSTSQPFFFLFCYHVISFCFFSICWNTKDPLVCPNFRYRSWSLIDKSNLQRALSYWFSLVHVIWSFKKFCIKHELTTTTFTYQASGIITLGEMILVFLGK